MKSGRIEGTEVVIFAGLATEIIAGDESKVTVMRIKVTPKFGALPHISYDEDKIFLVSAGTLRFTVQDTTFDVRAGECVTVKGGDVHGFVNLQQSDAIQVLVSTPARHGELACFRRSSAYSEAVIDMDAIRARFEALEPVLDDSIARHSG
jgi:mannose-6-phosphate isomerase-like protein (cupin superfamily)